MADKTPEQIAAEQAAADAAAKKAADDLEAARRAAEGPGADTMTPEQLRAEVGKAQAALGKANKEAEASRKKVEALEKAEADRQAATLTETEKLTKERDDALAAAKKADENARNTLTRAAFIAEAAKLGAVHPEDAFALADRSDVEIDENGKITGVAEAVKVLVEAGRLPIAAGGAPNLDGGAGGNGKHEKKVVLTPEELAIAKKMRIKPEDYAKQKAARS